MDGIMPLPYDGVKKKMNFLALSYPIYSKSGKYNSQSFILLFVGNTEFATKLTLWVV